MDKIESITDLKPQPRNINKGTVRGHAILGHAIRKHGAGRSGLAANDGTMIAGSQTLEKMAELGFEILPIHTNGNVWPVVIRDDIAPDSLAAREMAYADNRAAQVGFDEDAELLAALAAETDLSPLIREDELAALLARAREGAAVFAIVEDQEQRARPPEERLIPYLAGGIKQIVLYFDQQQYLAVDARLARLCQALGIETNTELFLHLLEHYEHCASKP